MSWRNWGIPCIDGPLYRSMPGGGEEVTALITRHLTTDKAVDLILRWKDSLDSYNLDYSRRCLDPRYMTSGMDYTLRVAVADELVDRLFGSIHPITTVAEYMDELETVIVESDVTQHGLQLYASHMESIVKEILLYLQEEERKRME